ELLADVEQTRVEVDVAPAEPECLADAEAAVGQEREEDAVGAGVGDEASEVALVEDADLPRTALRLLARLQARDGAGAHPAAPHGEAENLVERDERELRRVPRERLLVALRPLRHVVGRQVAQLHLAERAALRVGRAEHMAADDALVALARDRVPRAALPAAAFQPCLRRLADGPLRALDPLATVQACDHL